MCTGLVVRRAGLAQGQGGAGEAIIGSRSPGRDTVRPEGFIRLALGQGQGLDGEGLSPEWGRQGAAAEWGLGSYSGPHFLAFHGQGPLSGRAGVPPLPSVDFSRLGSMILPTLVSQAPPHTHTHPIPSPSVSAPGSSSALNGEAAS